MPNAARSRAIAFFAALCAIPVILHAALDEPKGAAPGVAEDTLLLRYEKVEFLNIQQLHPDTTGLPPTIDASSMMVEFYFSRDELSRIEKFSTDHKLRRTDVTIDDIVVASDLFSPFAGLREIVEQGHAYLAVATGSFDQQRLIEGKAQLRIRVRKP
ncbi:hypothetical protein EDE12_10489 [Methylosinus sp. sav-2]|jgi:hypothetical protein|nr:hypothetical protein EDE12_10489 [Methylosinus sp. sav-2]